MQDRRMHFAGQPLDGFVSAHDLPTEVVAPSSCSTLLAR